MRALIAIALIAALGAAGLGYAWHVLGRLPPPTPAAPAGAAPAQAADAPPSVEMRRVELVDEPATTPEAAARTRAPDGLEEGGGLPIVRDYAAIYADRTSAERDELAGRSRPPQTSSGVARLIALMEERAWLQAQLAAPRADDAGSGG